MKINLAKIDRFYQCDLGRYVARSLWDSIEDFCQTADSKTALTVASAGAFPFSKIMLDYCHALSLQAYDQVDNIPDDPSNMIVTNRSYWPYRAECVDRVICLHDLEFAEKPDVYLREAWRVLKGEGQLLLILPNRAGGWSRRDNNPFGQGYPFSLEQVDKILHQAHFQIDHVEGALYFPPYEPKTGLGRFYRAIIEKIGGCCMMASGVYIIHASKHIYSPTRGVKEITAQKARELLIGKATKASNRTNS